MCGCRGGDAATPGVRDGPEPNISVWMWLAAMPQPARPMVRSRMKADGPHI
jgi:hypothetical protein